MVTENILSVIDGDIYTATALWVPNELRSAYLSPLITIMQTDFNVPEAIINTITVTSM